MPPARADAIRPCSAGRTGRTGSAGLCCLLQAPTGRCRGASPASCRLPDIGLGTRGGFCSSTPESPRPRRDVASHSVVRSGFIARVETKVEGAALWHCTVPLTHKGNRRSYWGMHGTAQCPRGTHPPNTCDITWPPCSWGRFPGVGIGLCTQGVVSICPGHGLCPAPISSSRDSWDYSGFPWGGSVSRGCWRLPRARHYVPMPHLGRWRVMSADEDWGSRGSGGRCSPHSRHRWPAATAHGGSAGPGRRRAVG